MKIRSHCTGIRIIRACPTWPNASKLMYFLNESHKGYCAYFAGATLFMLRSLGIPSRIAVGFLTEDRSDKNKGWYWYYANQAHAWVQVYFPGYGWLDFDTTVGNDNESRPTPQPDGTPPMQPPKAWFAADGVVENIDTLKKRMTVSIKQMVFHDKEYKMSSPVRVEMDMKVAAIYRDSVPVPLRNVQKGDEGTAVSYAEALKNIEPGTNESADALVHRLPAPTPVDEVYLKRKDQAKKEEKKEAAVAEKQVSYKTVLWTLVGILVGFVVLVLTLPRMILAYYAMRYKRGKADGNKGYWAYRAAAYFLHMVGMPRGNRTPMQYAREVADPHLGMPNASTPISFTAFMNVYLKQKYAKQPLTGTEQQVVEQFLQPFLANARRKVSFGKRLGGFLNPVRSAAFFVRPEEDEKEA
jgi:hypothetical protein